MAERKKPAAKKAAAKKRAAKKPAAKKKAPAKKPAAKKAAAKPKPEPMKLNLKPPAPKPASKPKAAEPRLPSLKTALGWSGMRIDGTDKQLGKLAGILVDADDGRPRWAVIRLGRIAGHTAIPYEHVAEGGDRLFAAYERGWVREAPRFKPTAALSADQELELCAHWGIRRDKARSGELQGRKPDEITAVPAES